MSFEEIYERLKNTLTESRFSHTLGVVSTAESLALHYGCDVQKARLAALCHDAAKNIDHAELKKTAKNAGIRLDSVSKHSGALLHAYVGAYMAKTEFGIDDAEVLEAIYYHTTGKRDMSLLCKIIFLSDMIEPGRIGIRDLDKMRREAYSDLDGALVTAFNSSICHVINEGGLLHPDTVRARNYILEKRGERKHGNQ